MSEINGTHALEEPVVPSGKRQKTSNNPRTCPYLGTINRHLLDFDFEKVCSVSLSGQNVYVDLVDGKYFQGRGKNTHAYRHALEKGHYVWMNLHDGKVYCIPDDYEVVDASLNDIKYNLNPTFVEEDIDAIESNVVYAKSLDGSDFIPGVLGMNNLGKNTDYLNAVVQTLCHVIPLRKFMLQYRPKDRVGQDQVSATFAMLMRKIFNHKNFKGIVSPHEFVQAVGTASKKRFFTTKQQDPCAFFCFLMGHMHQRLKNRKGTSIITDCFQGEMSIKTIGLTDNSIHIAEQPFFVLTLDLPQEPLFKDKVEFIPQIQLFTLMEKFNGESTHEVTGENKIRKFALHKLPPYLVMQVRRFQKNNFFTEKNPTIVNFPLKQLDLKDYLHPDWVLRNPCTHYDLIGNICHDGKPTGGTWKSQVYHAPLGHWYETQDLRVTQVLPQMVALSESYMMIYKRQDVTDEGFFQDMLDADMVAMHRNDVEDNQMDVMDADELAEAGIIIG